MAEFTYTYSISLDFPLGLAPGQFTTEVENSTLGPIFLRVDTSGDNCYVVFSASLTGPQLTTLNGLVAAHDPAPTNLIFNAPGYSQFMSDLSDSQAVQIKANDVNGGVYIYAGDGGIEVETTNAFVVNAGAVISLTNTVGNITTSAAGLAEINAVSGINIGNNADAAPINIGTGASVRTITIGNNTGATAVAMTSGTGSITLTSSNAGANSIQFNSTGGITSSVAGTINLATSSSSATAIILDAAFGGGGIFISSGAQGISVNSAGGLIGIGNGSGGDIQLGTAAVARTIRFGNNTGGTRIFEKWGTGGYISYQPSPVALADAAATVTIANLLVGLLTISPTVDRNITLPTAALAVAGISTVSVDDCIDFRIMHLSTGVTDPIVSIVMGAGGTAVGNMSIYPFVNNAGTYNYSGTATLRMRFTNVGGGTEAYTIYRIA